MSRERQRRNRRFKKSKPKPWFNHEGYHDPTAYLAIKNALKSNT